MPWEPFPQTLQEPSQLQYLVAQQPLRTKLRSVSLILLKEGHIDISTHAARALETSQLSKLASPNHLSHKQVRAWIYLGRSDTAVLVDGLEYRYLPQNIVFKLYHFSKYERISETASSSRQVTHDLPHYYISEVIVLFIS